MAGNSTLLRIESIDSGPDIDLADFASRDIVCTLAPIATGSLRRDVDGELHDMTLAEFRKYALSIECTDLEALDLTGVWRGRRFRVTLIPGMGVREGTDGDTDDELTLRMMVDVWQNVGRERRVEFSWTMTLFEI